MNKKQAFTLIEMLMVMCIIAILLGMIVGAAAWAKNRARINKCKYQLELLKDGLLEYHMKTQFYPACSNTISLNENPRPDWVDEIIEMCSNPRRASLVDPWGNGFLYENDWDLTEYNSGSYSRDQYKHMDFKLWSLGPDKKPETGDEIGTKERPTND